MSRVEKVLKIQTESLNIFVQFFKIWNSNEQYADMKIPRSKTLLVGFIIYMSGLIYTLVIFEVSWSGGKILA